MERTTKARFIALSNRKIVAYETYIKALEVLITMAKDWNGKKMNKRYVDKANTAFKENNLTDIRFGFDTRWNGERDNRFKINYDNRWVAEVNAYIYDTEEIIFTHCGDYMDKPDYVLNSENFIGALKCEVEILTEKIDELRTAVDSVDDVINKYKEMNKFVKETMDTIPYPLKSYFTISCPIY